MCDTAAFLFAALWKIEFTVLSVLAVLLSEYCFLAVLAVGSLFSTVGPTRRARSPSNDSAGLARCLSRNILGRCTKCLFNKNPMGGYLAVLHFAGM